jgi:glycosyltransferase involved in cell wall biosynthesis
MWLIHQHRSVYDLWGSPFIGDLAATEEGQALRKAVVARDTACLKCFEHIHTISRRVSARLLQFNGLKSTPLYHPPPLADKYHCASYQPYIFAPGRIEALKRLDLIITALKHVSSPVTLVIGGEGGGRLRLEQLIAENGLQHRVRLLGRVDETTLLSFYANCLAVFFAPYDEDYGYVTLEAMLAQKPVIICADSGGPVEFVVHDETGFVVEPRAECIAVAIDDLYRRNRAADLGRAGLDRYYQIRPDWKVVVDTLLA